jgi:purine-binding chemotaxis protein CheW
LSEINTHQKDSELLQLVGFRLGKEEFVIDILNVNEILKMLEVTVIPNSPSYVEGIVNIRDKIIAVIDTRQKLNMPKKEYDQDTRIIVVELNGRIVGFIVDEVNEVLRIPKNITEQPPDLLSANIESDYITSIARFEDRLLILLDLNKLMSEAEIVKF